MKTSGWFTFLLLMAAFLVVKGLDKDIIGINSEDQFFKSFTATKMLEECFRKENVDKWKWNRQKIWYECEREVRPFHPNITKATEPYHFKDDPFYDYRRTGHLKYHTDISIQVLQCVFDRLHIRIAVDGNVNTRDYKRVVNRQIKMGTALKHYVNFGINQCARRASCEEFNDLGEEYEYFVKLHEFYKCEMYSRLVACIKYDLGLQGGNYELQYLGNTIKNLYKNGKRLAVSLLYANSDYKSPFKYDI